MAKETHQLLLSAPKTPLYRYGFHLASTLSQ